MYKSSEVAALFLSKLQIPNTMATATLDDGVCESLHIDHRAYRTNASAADFIQNFATGTVVDLANGSSASS